MQVKPRLPDHGWLRNCFKKGSDPFDFRGSDPFLKQFLSGSSSASKRAASACPIESRFFHGDAVNRASSQYRQLPLEMGDVDGAALADGIASAGSREVLLARAAPGAFPRSKRFVGLLTP